ncbi:MAG: hypothetical protein U9O87_02030 [Verrucomicrobiota bacterium]|nr:hypothetical protein [Verrucomicrobiota bacterium]
MNNIKKLDKSHIVVTSLDENDGIAYWHSKTPEERLQALELNRSLVYGYGEHPPRLQRFLEVVDQPWSS